jgi:hypothetical protein
MLTKVDYVCRKCGKMLTVEGHKSILFCPNENCGTLLNEKPQPKHWLFQFNPSTYKWLNRIKETKEPEQWLVTHHANLIHKGDLVAVWGSSENGGIYGLGKIITDTMKDHLNINQLRYFVRIDDTAKFEEKYSAYVEYFKVSGEKPLLEQKLCDEDKILCNLPVFKNPQGTNFSISPEQWNRIFELTEKLQ